MFDKFKNVLVFAAHHDDETLGCGGTIARLSDWYANITVVFFTNGATGIDQAKTHKNNIIHTRQQEANKAAKILGIKQVVNLGHPCQQLNNTQGLLHNTISLIRQYKPDLILSHSFTDRHRDHKVVASVTEESYYKAYENIHPELGKRHKPTLGLSYEVLEQHPTVDISFEITSADLDKKIMAFKEYDSQHKLLSADDNIVDFMKSLATVRGFQNNKKYCESFRFLGNNRLVL
tara:strand:+ start:61 stop:759 length:699 start_codon:yes stop_codon:yes gene_type:complete